MTWALTPWVPRFAISEQEAQSPATNFPQRVRLAIAGSRTLFPSVWAISAAVAGWLPPWSTVVEVVSGRAPGVDRAGEAWARRHRIPVVPFPARWQAHGPAAGPIRNGEIAAYADALLAWWNGRSTGTRDVIAKMRRLGKPVRVLLLEGRS